MTDLVRAIEDRFCASPAEQRERLERAIQDITARAVGSSAYAGRIETITSLDELGVLPLTPYEHIQEVMERDGQDRVLLAPPLVAFRTSGSTGAPKEFHYGPEDIERIIGDYRLFSHLIGVRRGMVGWNLAGAPPDVSGYLLDRLARDLGVTGTTSLLKDDRDLVRALKQGSKMERVDVVASGALVIYLVGRMSQEPEFLPGIVTDKVVRSYHLPRPLARAVAWLYLRGINTANLRAFADTVSVGISFAESLDTYRAELRRCYPRLQVFDIYGSTENPIMAAQLVKGAPGLATMVGAIIPELVPSEDIRVASDHPPQAVPWYEWKAGMKGELVVTRPGQCLPLIRYPTGDVVEVLDPQHTDRIVVDGTAFDVTLPHIRVLGRTTDTLDYEAHDEAGNFMGVKIYSRFVNEALFGSSGVRWWELYNVRDVPARLAMVVIPEKDPADPKRFQADVRRRLLEERTDVPQMFEIACDLRRFDVIVLRADAFRVVQAEIDRRIKKGRSLGQLKPKHIYKIDGLNAFRRLMKEKYDYELPAPEKG